MVLLPPGFSSMQAVVEHLRKERSGVVDVRFWYWAVKSRDVSLLVDMAGRLPARLPPKRQLPELDFRVAVLVEFIKANDVEGLERVDLSCAQVFDWESAHVYRALSRYASMKTMCWWIMNIDAAPASLSERAHDMVAEAAAAGNKALVDWFFEVGRGRQWDTASARVRCLRAACANNRLPFIAMFTATHRVTLADWTAPCDASGTSVWEEACRGENRVAFARWVLFKYKNSAGWGKAATQALVYAARQGRADLYLELHGSVPALTEGAPVWELDLPEFSWKKPLPKWEKTECKSLMDYVACSGNWKFVERLVEAGAVTMKGLLAHMDGLGIGQNDYDARTDADALYNHLLYVLERA